MKTFFKIYMILFIFSGSIRAQSPQDLSIELSTFVNKGTPSIKISWKLLDAASNYTLSRKNLTASSWTSLGNFDSATNTFEDKNVNIGQKYEYKIEGKGTNFSAFGYVASGIDIDRTLQAGKAILIIDEEITDSLNFEINRWIHDAQNEGWEVKSLTFKRDVKVNIVRDSIKNIYSNTSIRPVSIFLLGHVPVPYSGNLAPDGHTPDHLGAWPCDGYYGEVENYFTDTQIINSNASDNRNDNIPGDGKFDQSNFFGNLEMQVGRVDMHNLPAFSESEIQLLKKYLNKNHAFRTAQFKPRFKAVIDDNFGYFSGESFSTSGWRNFSSLIGFDNIESSDYFTSLNADSYLWSYGCGGGNYSGAGGVGNTQNFASSSPKGVFTLLFGSYFGDWDSQNNFMRASLASGDILTCAWAGRPHWYFHHMGFGETIGYSAQQTMGNSFTYFTHYGSRFTHTALLGDPTLKHQYSKNPISDINVSQVGPNVSVSWTSNVGIDSFLLLKHEENAPSWEFVGFTDKQIFVDSCITNSKNVRYKVAIIDSIQSRTATYTESLGKSSEFILTKPYENTIADATFLLDDNKVIFQNNSSFETSITWNFGDGNIIISTDSIVSHIYDSLGTYVITMTATNGCSNDFKSFTINVLSEVKDLDKFDNSHLYPNPATDKIYIKTLARSYLIIDQLGNIVNRNNFSNNELNVLDISNLNRGLYYLQLNTDDSQILNRLKFIKL